MAEIKWHNEKRAIRDLIPYEVNPRQITNKQAKDLKASLAKFGIADPLIINTDNMIIGGHQRKKILETLLGYDPDYQIDVRVPDRELSIDEARELNVRLNKNVADWDFDILANNFELDDLLEWGFDKKELDIDLWAGDPPEDVEPQIDKAEELRVKWGVESGQLWQLGEHRLVCGDCTDKAVVERVMGGERADMVFTDPPYGVDYEGGTTPREKLSGDATPDLYEPAMQRISESTIEKVAVYLWHSDSKSAAVSAAVSAAGFERRCTIIWNKNQAQFGALGAQYKTKHEPVYYLFKKGKSPNWYGPTNEVTVWDVDRESANKLHPTQKPIELAERAMNNSSKVGDLVLDLFLGSGTTLIACERLGRKCRAVEISPAYVAVAIQRWVDVTGKEPMLLTL